MTLKYYFISILHNRRESKVDIFDNMLSRIMKFPNNMLHIHYLCQDQSICRMLPKAQLPIKFDNKRWKCNKYLCPYKILRFSFNKEEKQNKCEPNRSTTIFLAIDYDPMGVTASPPHSRIEQRFPTETLLINLLGWSGFLPARVFRRVHQEGTIYPRRRKKYTEEKPLYFWRHWEIKN